VTDDPAAIRDAMADTRTALEEKLAELKTRFTSDSIPQPRNLTMAKKKAAKKSSKKASKKGKAPSKKSAGGAKKKAVASGKRASKKAAGGKKSGGKKPTVKSAVGKVAKQATEVMQDVLAGAAVGAAQGAANVVVDKVQKSNSGQK